MKNILFQLGKGGGESENTERLDHQFISVSACVNP